MVQDHSKANEQLKAVAAAKSLTFPTATPEDQMLSQTKGADFDRSYVQMMVKDHEENVAMFEKAANNLPDPEVRAFAAQTLPVLKEHLAMIKKSFRILTIIEQKPDR
jgi:putative membrane protein